jgi:hypothetical protein
MNSAILSYPRTEIFSVAQLMPTSFVRTQSSKAGLPLIANLSYGASGLLKSRPKQGHVLYLNTSLPVLAVLTFHAKRKLPQPLPHVRPFLLNSLISFNHSTMLPLYHLASVLRHPPTPSNHPDLASGVSPTSSLTTPAEPPPSRDLDTACATFTFSIIPSLWFSEAADKLVRILFYTPRWSFKRSIKWVVVQQRLGSHGIAHELQLYDTHSIIH